MNAIFADTHFWIALTHPRDQWHDQAVFLRNKLIDPFFVTTDFVLVELLTFYSEGGPETRAKAADTVDLIYNEPNTEVIPASHEGFLAGLELYKNRPDKEYSLTDCISMNICRERGITDVLSHDHHFSQEGLTVLM